MYLKSEILSNKMVLKTEVRVLEKSQIDLARLGIYVLQTIEPSNRFYKFSPNFYIFVLIAVSILASGGYVFENIHTNVRLALNACIMVISTFQWLGMYFGIRLEMCQIKNLHRKLQSIVDKGEHSTESYLNR